MHLVKSYTESYGRVNQKCFFCEKYSIKPNLLYFGYYELRDLPVPLIAEGADLPINDSPTPIVCCSSCSSSLSREEKLTLVKEKMS